MLVLKAFRNSNSVTDFAKPKPKSAFKKDIFFLKNQQKIEKLKLKKTVVANFQNVNGL